MSNWIIGKYIRLSQADRDLYTGGKEESDSVTHQRAMIQSYIDGNKELANCEQYEFFDDGYSGTDFSRPGFEKMIEMIKRREINCVIVKDFSRFGRDYLELGDYLERIFPFLRVRFISVNDGYDSENYEGTTGGMDVVLKNIVYAYYSKDLSVKVKTAKTMKAKKGMRVGGEPPYGFRKDPTNKDNLLLDPEAAPVVREIFDRYLAGEKPTAISRALNERGVDTPSTHYKKTHKGCRLYGNQSQKHCWGPSMISDILNRDEYYGAFVGHKLEVKKIGSDISTVVPKEERIIIEGKYEPIVTKEEFLAVQAIRTRNGFQNTTPINYPLRSKVFCGVCGRRCMYTTAQKRRYTYFKCKYSGEQTGPDKCTNLWMPEAQLNDTVLEYIRKMILLADAAEDRVREKCKGVEQNCQDMEKEKEKLQRSREGLEQEQMNLMERFFRQEINQTEFAREKERLAKEIEKLDKEIAALDDWQETAKSESEQLQETETAVETILQFREEEKLDRKMVEALIDKVIYYDPEHVEIKGKFSDEVMKAMRERG